MNENVCREKLVETRTEWGYFGHESGPNCGTRNTRELVILRLHPAGTEMSAGVLLASSFYSLCFMHTADFQGSLFPSLLNCF